jgi:DNA-directed RNA polymerase subunit RPC12/RpoP
MQTEAEDLKQYFKFVCKCSTCGRSYGSDLQKEDNGICPYCMPGGVRKFRLSKFKEKEDETQN